MHDEQSIRPTGLPRGVVLLVAIVALVLATAALTATVVGRGQGSWPGFGIMAGTGTTAAYGGYGGYGGIGGYGGMMGGGVYGSSLNPYSFTNGPQPGESGFVAGTPAAPRVVHVIAGPGDVFTPATISVALGETVTFVVTTMGPAVHEFKVGPAADVAADRDGTPEVADIGMMQTKSVTYTFAGSGPFAYACHAPGHYEAGMRGTITVVG